MFMFCVSVYVCVSVCVCVSLLSLGSPARETPSCSPQPRSWSLGPQHLFLPWGYQSKDWVLLGSGAGIWVGICLCRREPFLRGMG